MTKIVIFDSWMLFFASIGGGIRMKLSDYFTEKYNLRRNNPRIIGQRCDLVWIRNYKLT